MSTNTESRDLTSEPAEVFEQHLRSAIEEAGREADGYSVRRAVAFHELVVLANQRSREAAAEGRPADTIIYAELASEFADRRANAVRKLTG